MRKLHKFSILKNVAAVAVFSVLYFGFCFTALAQSSDEDSGGGISSIPNPGVTPVSLSPIRPQEEVVVVLKESSSLSALSWSKQFGASQIYLLDSSTLAYDMAIDSSGKIHVVYGDGVSLYYVSGNNLSDLNPYNRINIPITGLNYIRNIALAVRKTVAGEVLYAVIAGKNTTNNQDEIRILNKNQNWSSSFVYSQSNIFFSFSSQIDFRIPKWNPNQAHIAFQEYDGNKTTNLYEIIYDFLTGASTVLQVNIPPTNTYPNTYPGLFGNVKPFNFVVDYYGPLMIFKEPDPVNIGVPLRGVHLSSRSNSQSQWDPPFLDLSGVLFSDACYSDLGLTFLATVEGFGDHTWGGGVLNFRFGHGNFFSSEIEIERAQNPFFGKKYVLPTLPKQGYLNTPNATIYVGVYVNYDGLQIFYTTNNFVGPWQKTPILYNSIRGIASMRMEVR
ncbi:MAG: hypothetical protein A2787_02610 [Omnitrophica WOR_2 bacterium RIFCSPHIGHO2_01_FULL_48_9]|nr:MAG: hypothetical protein A2787_02610 [Omnitrophica WOR_2 bacterium RIFCSPHIGHO2_01_FULL_48_9]